ncbi:MAG: SEC-C domain-containing protein, partial [Alphaproteobacteria bacterium]|nr:SEC-C domain-containing protein [Alphaproteobacteria bacterium]
AYIIAEAGAPGSVTIATNMAGRGTDIQLGGNVEMRIRREIQGIDSEVERSKRISAIRADVAAKKEIALAAGGLYVIGTERHESRRIDNQLRGRSGRQGDPGASKFFVSLEDDLMRIFGSERMDGMLQKLGLKEGEAIIHPWINKALEKAQQKVEARNYEIRKQVIKYDDVMNDQRKVVYEQRKEIMSARDVGSEIADMRHEVIDLLTTRCVPPTALPDQWDVKGLHEECLRLLNLDLPVADWAKEEGIGPAEMTQRVKDAADRKMAEKAANYGPDIMRMAEKSLLLQLLDQIWKDHLLSLDHLRQGINLRAYAQRDPLNEYKREAFELFEGMLVHLREAVTSVLSHVELRVQRGEEPVAQQAAREPAMAGGDGRPARPVGRGSSNGELGPRKVASGGATGSSGAGFDPKTPRNAPCPCGSGKKFKHCHGRV